MAKRKGPTAATLRRKRDNLIGQLPNFHEILRGSLVQRYRRCGQPNCRCNQPGDPGHGPSWYLMVTVERGKTVRVYVPEDKKVQVQKRIDNFRSLREKIEKISTLNRELLKGGRLFEQD